MKVLWMAYVWPEPESSAAGLRTWGLVDALRAAGHSVVFASACKPNPALEAVRGRGLEAHEVRLNDSAFDALVTGMSPDVVVFDRFMVEEQFGWRVEKACPNALRVIDTIDLHFLRKAREVGSELWGDDLFRELASVLRSDLSWMISDVETALLRDSFGVPAELLQTVRFSYVEPSSGPSFEERSGFSFIGSFRHPPNVDAIAWLYSEIWPALRQRLPAAELRIYGSYPTKEWMERDDPRIGFRVLGAAESAITELARARVNLAPLRFGAGIKGKISDGWAAGTPAVTTPIGAEGMHESFPFGGWIAGSAVEFVDACVRLYESPGEWTVAAERGRAILRGLYDPGVNARAVVERLEAQIRDRDVIRRRNLMGALLRHHGARSTEYFSRWIELKERLRQAGSV